MMSGWHFHQFLASGDLGGAAVIGLRVAEHLNSVEDEMVTVWIPGAGRAERKAADLRLPTEIFSTDDLFSQRRARAALANLRLGLRLRRKGRNLLHIHSPFLYRSGLHAFRWAALRRVVHIHLDYEADGLRWALREPPELIVTCARFLEERVRTCLPAAHRDRQRIAVIPNAVDLDQFHAGEVGTAKDAVGAPRARPLLLMMANLAPHKGQETAIRAVAELRRRGIEVHCWLAGEDREVGGRFGQRLSALIGNLGLSSLVTLLGFREDGPELLRAADFLLLPSTREGLPLSVLEAQASKTVVLAASTAGIPEVVEDGRTGFLIGASDAQGYAHRIEHLLGRPEVYQAVAEEAHDRCAGKHSWPAYLQATRQAYREVLDVPARHPLVRPPGRANIGR